MYIYIYKCYVVLGLKMAPANSFRIDVHPSNKFHGKMASVFHPCPCGDGRLWVSLMEGYDHGHMGIVHGLYTMKYGAEGRFVPF